MQDLSLRIKNLPESATIKMAQLSRELKEQGHDVISLSLGEPDFDTPDFIKQAAKEALDEGYTSYTPVPGYLSFRKAISEKLKRDNGLNYSPSQIVVSTGAKQSIANVALCLLDKDDEVLLPAPYWVSYSAIVQLAEAKSVELPTTIDTDFKITPAQLEKAITKKTKMIIFSSPCNPTGSVYTEKELSDIAGVLAKHPNIYIVSDEIYEYINYVGTHASIAHISSIKDRVIVVNGFSKGFAMTGWRLGYIAAPEWIAKACDKLQGQVTSGTNSIAQKAGEAAIKGGMKAPNAMRDAFKKRRDMMIGWLREIPGLKVNEPKGAFYIFPDVSYYFGKSYKDTTIQNPSDLALFVLNDSYVGMVTGEAFGDANCVRLSYAASEETLQKAVQRIKSSLAKLS